MIWKQLPQSELERLIGSTVLEQIADIGPAIFPEGHTDIYLKANLVKLANAFITLDHMTTTSFRRLLFSCLPEEVLRKVHANAFPSVGRISIDKMREQLIKTPWSNTEYCKSVAVAAGMAEWLVPERSKAFEQTKAVSAPKIPFKQLKAYQFSVFDGAIETLSVPNGRCIIQMPTGSGKTRTAMEIVSHFLNEFPDKKVVWIAHSGELCEQAVESFEQVWTHLGRSDCTYVRFWSSADSKHLQSEESRFIVCSYGKLGSLSRGDKQVLKSLSSECSLIVVDEAHMAVAPTFKDLILSIKGDGTAILGLTATPGRESDDSSAELSEFFFNKLLTLKAPDNRPILEYLRARKILAKVVHQTLDGARVELTSSQLRKLESQDDFGKEILSQVGQDRIRNLQIIKALKNEAIQGNSVLYFAPSIEQSKFVCSFLIYLGIPAAHVDGEIAQSQRRVVIERYKRGEVRVLCNYGVLATGFDAPKTNVVVIARPTQSVVLYSQMIGRGLRGPVIGGTETCKVIEVIDNFVNMPKFNALHDYFEDYFSGD